MPEKLHTPAVLLVLPPYRSSTHALFPGIAFLAGALKAAGCRVAVFDGDVAAFAAHDSNYTLESMLTEMCKSFCPSLVGLYVNTPNYRAALKMAQLLNTLVDVPLLAGGPHATLAGESILRHHSEFIAVVGGEAEQLLPALAWAMLRDGRLPEAAKRLEQAFPSIASTSGASTFLLFPENGSIRKKNFSPPLLEELACPDRSVLLDPPCEPIERVTRYFYRKNFFHTFPAFHGHSVLTTHVSRGCTGNCPFCAPAALNNASCTPLRRLRPPAKIAEELEKSHELGFTAWYFDEPAFPLAEPGAWGHMLRDIFSRQAAPWGCVARLDEVLTADMPAWAASGLRYLYVGLETPNQQLQKRLGKQVDPEKAVSTTDYLNTLGIHCDLSVFFGMPGESVQSTDHSIRWLNARLPRGNVFFSLAAYWPGTPWSLAAGLTPDCWEPNHDRTSGPASNLVWYPEDTPYIDRFFSNGTGTYHPAMLTIEEAGRLRKQIEDSGLRERFALHSRCINKRIP